MGLLFPSSLPLGLEMKREDSPVSHEKIRTRVHMVVNRLRLMKVDRVLANPIVTQRRVDHVETDVGLTLPPWQDPCKP